MPIKLVKGIFLSFAERAIDVQLLDIEKIMILRQQRGWSQRHLAEMANIDPSVITRLEKGQQQNFMISVVFAIANALDVPIDTLLIHSKLQSQRNLVPELQSAITLLTQQPDNIQRHAAGMIHGYLNALE